MYCTYWLHLDAVLPGANWTGARVSRLVHEVEFGIAVSVMDPPLYVATVPPKFALDDWDWTNAGLGASIGGPAVQNLVDLVCADVLAVQPHLH
mmetsp:Transcript_55033/g.126581  ORF Transcript_55033/g.126581 Transcript_55033/m.126581 type:complete len:93 (-) Transcript_55033:403-681(-)